MATQILPVAAGAADSAPDTVVAAGAQLVVSLKSASAQVTEGQVRVFLKDDANNYNQVDFLTWQRPAVTLPAGTYRFSRVAGSGTVGVFSA